MEYSNQENREMGTTQMGISDLMKKSLSLIQSAYFFSILFFSSSLFFLILHIIKPNNFSVLPLFSFLKFSIDRNYMFLLCNGILVILVKSSSSSKTSQESKVCDETEKRVVVVAMASEVKTEYSVPQEQSFVDEKQDLLTVEEDLNQEIDDHDHDEDVTDDDHEEDVFDADELNKRCEEFIWKMKQGIISESRNDRCFP